MKTILANEKKDGYREDLILDELKKYLQHPNIIKWNGTFIKQKDYAFIFEHCEVRNFFGVLNFLSFLVQYWNFDNILYLFI